MPEPSALQVDLHILEPSAMQVDLHILHDAWTSLHPGLYRYNSPGQIEAYFKALEYSCSLPLEEKQFYLKLSQLAQQVRCGHTYLNPLNLDKETASRILPQKVIPFFFEIINRQQLIITRVLDTSLLHPGDEVLAINGIPVRQILDSLLTISRSDGNHSLGKKYNNINELEDELDAYSLFDIYFPLFFNPANRLRLSIKPYSQTTSHTIAVTALSLTERSSAYKMKYGSVPTAEKTWAYRLIDSKTAYMKFGTFAFWNSAFNEKRFVDSAFMDIQLHPGIKNLIIDIRNNEGGDNTGDYILSHLSGRKLDVNEPDHRCYRYLIVPDSLLPYLQTWDNSFKKPKNPAGFFTNRLGLNEQKKAARSDSENIEQKSDHFTGRVFLLVNATNSSAGYEMARKAKINKLATLVGETTGGSQQGINGGEFFFLTLPYSKIEIDLPLIFNYHPDQPDSGIKPNYEVLTRQADIAMSRDSQLEFVMKIIR